MLSYVTESPVILDRPLSRTTLFVFLLYTASNKNVKQSIHVLHTDSFISHTFGKWQKTCYTFVPRRITDGNHLLLYIVSQKLKKVNPVFCISIAILCTCIILHNHQFYATGITLRILPAKSHKIFLSIRHYPVYLVLFPPQNMDKSAPNNTRYPPFSGSGTLGDKIFCCEYSNLCSKIIINYLFSSINIPLP